SGLRYANLADPALMLLTLKNAYQTCGILLTSMLAFSVIYSAYRHKGLEISLLLYFSAGYYFMISATEAVGYLRHAQPFYIAPVFLLALWAADSAPTKLRGRNIRPAYLLLLPLLIFQAVFVKDAFQRTTFFTPVAYDFPYWEVAHYLKNLGDAPLSVYAPMEVEPSHFYLAKSGLAGKITWDRTLPPAFSAKKAAGIYGTKLYDFMLLPYSPFPH
ncbi:MAG: hypothetical protein COT18_06330, partial [Elusimicrobia bacterium CG08_land_8_20_14_0_20_59_10]